MVLVKSGYYQLLLDNSTLNEALVVSAMVGTEADVPRILYKYRSLAPEYRRNTISIFENNQLWYAQASSFNDPFDCNFDIPTDRSTEEWEQVFQKVIELLHGGFRSLATQVQSALAQSRARTANKAEVLPAVVDEKAETPKLAGSPKLSMGSITVDEIPKTLAEALNPSMAEYASELKKKLDERVGVLSLTEVPDDILMWSHYTNGHAGICLEFDVGTYRDRFPNLGTVRYQGEYPEITDKFVSLMEIFRRTDLSTFNRLLDVTLSSSAMLKGAEAEADQTLDLMKHWFFTKSAHWSYEKEWRAISARPGLNTFPAAALSGVVVGCVNTKSNLALVRECVKRRRRKVKLYVAEKVPSAFRLRISEVE
jgi:hypothetical protein